jgi:hypothetical protein
MIAASAWLAALAALALPSSEDPLLPPAVEVGGPDGSWTWLSVPRDGDVQVLALTAISPLIPRAEVGRGATTPVTPGPALSAQVEVALRAGNRPLDCAPRLTAVVHGVDEELLLMGGAPRVFRDARPPAAAGSSAGADLAHLLRRDDEVVAGGTVSLEPPAVPHSHVLLFGLHPRVVGTAPWPIEVDGEPHLLHPGATRPLVLPATGAPMEVELGDALLDAVQFATLVPGDLAESEAFLHQVSQADVRITREDGSRSFGWTDAAGLSEDRRVVPEGHRRAYRFAMEPPGRLLEEGETLGFVLRPGVRGRAADPASVETARSRDHAPRALVRRPTVDLTRFTAADSPESLVEVTRSAGLAAYTHAEGPREQLDIRPTMGPGAAWGDVNEDGALDLVLLQGAGRAGCQPLSDRLFLGRGDGTFEDGTARAGLGRGDAGMGALLVDLNGDGHLDLYCANYGRDRLFLGAGDGTFAEAEGVLPALSLWSASVIAGDPDGDGDLDLYVTSYLDYDLEKMPPADELGLYQREDPVEMLPFAFPGQRNVFLRSRLADTGAFGFEDATEELGLADVQGRGMQAVFWDFDLDGDEDLYVANDVSFNVLFRNEGDGTFKDVSFSTGLDDPRGGMGLAIGDVDNDGDSDVFLTNWQLETNALYTNSAISSLARKRRRSTFHDTTVKSGFGPSGIGKTSWGAEFFDLELDGDLDLYVANGYTSPDYESTGICVGQTDQLFVGDGTGKLKEACTLGRRAFSISRASRGAVGADHDRDGDIDLLVTANNGGVTLLRNDAERAGRWLGVRLRQPGLNQHGIGANVAVATSDGFRREQALRAGTGYLTGNAPELHFGLGPVDEFVEIQVTWPDGEVTRHQEQADTWVVIQREG